jgi:hypothetical protein
LIPALAGNAISGVARFNQASDFAGCLCARLLALCIALDGRPAQIPLILTTARNAAHSAPVPLPDPLPVAAQEVLRAYSRRFPEIQLAEAALIQLFAHCVAEDRALVRRAILTS